MHRSFLLPPIAARLAAALLAAALSAQDAGTVLAQQVLNGTEGSLAGVLTQGGNFGESVTWLGDLDGDGVGDIAVGANNGGPDACLPPPAGCANGGLVWILFLNSDGSVKSYQPIGENVGGFDVDLDPADRFGEGIATVGDIDGDGVIDLVVGASGDDDGYQVDAVNVGAVWVLFLNSDGTVRDHQKISETEGGFNGDLDNFNSFGGALARIKDLDGDGVDELAVGAGGDDDGGISQGAVWILQMNTDGTVDRKEKISSLSPALNGALDDYDFFGISITYIDDFDGDGVGDLAVGSYRDDDGMSTFTEDGKGAVYLLFLNTDGTLKSYEKISQTVGGFTGQLDDRDGFGRSIAFFGDLDGNGVGDLVVGAYRDDDGENAAGAVWVLFLDADGSVLGHQKISALEGGLQTPLAQGDEFGESVAFLGDIDGDGTGDLAVGAHYVDNGTEANTGAVYILSLAGVAPAFAQVYGCGVNPTGSISIEGELPELGAPFLVGLSNPVGTQPAGSLTLLALGFAPDAAFPCGTLAPSFGMAGPGAPGELLIDFSASPIYFGGPPLPLEGVATVAIDIPLAPALVGATGYAQGVVIDPTLTSGVLFGLTDAIKLRVGP